MRERHMRRPTPVSPRPSASGDTGPVPFSALYMSWTLLSISPWPRKKTHTAPIVAFRAGAVKDSWVVDNEKPRTGWANQPGETDAPAGPGSLTSRPRTDRRWRHHRVFP